MGGTNTNNSPTINRLQMLQNTCTSSCAGVGLSRDKLVNPYNFCIKVENKQ